MVITADLMHYKTLNEQIKQTADKEVTVDNCIGQRYIACGMSGKYVTINGVPGNALGAYLDGSTIEVFGNAQDATGDTMNEGDIIIHGNCGDATGYGMRGGRIFIEGNAGYRAGIHMKAYQQKLPTLVIGGTAGSFLGEYQAGGIILVLGNGADGRMPVSYFCGTGMHGGKIFLRCDKAPAGLPYQVLVTESSKEDKQTITPLIEEYCRYFGGDARKLSSQKFYTLSPNPQGASKQLYTTYN